MTHPELVGFPVVVEVNVAWGDMDSYAHVNNVVYFRYFENARIPYLDRIGWLASMRETALGPILASTSARFRKPLTYPDQILVGTKLTAMATDRITIAYRIVSTKLNAVACEGEGVVVSYDYRGGTKVPIPEAIRSAIEQLERRQ